MKSIDERRLSLARRQRLSEALESSDLDALVLTSPESVDYASGYRSAFGRLSDTSLMAAVVVGDDVRLLVSTSDALAAEEAAHAADDIDFFGPFYFYEDQDARRQAGATRAFGDAVRLAVSDLPGGRIGVEDNRAGGIVRDALPAGRTAVDASTWALRVRSVKTSDEQQLLRNAAQIAESALREALDLLAEGITERDLADTIAVGMSRRGADPRYVVVTSGERSAYVDAFPAHRNVCEGDLVRFDIGCQVRGYWSDIARTRVLGAGTPLQHARHSAIVAGLEEEISLIRPGMRVSELFARTVAAVENAGIVPYRRQHVGHAVGLSIYETPVIRWEDDAALTSGMVFSVETPFYQEGWGGTMVEDAGVVTESGFELFTHLDRGLLHGDAR